MNRRGFIKRGAMWVPAVVGLKAYPQALTLADPAKVLSGPSGPAACDTIKEQQTTYDSTAGLGDGTTSTWVATKFTPSTSFSVCSIQFYARGIPGASNIDVRAGIYSDSSGSPGSLIGGWTANYTASIGTTFGWIDMGALSSDASVTSGTSYFLVLNALSTSVDYILLGLCNSGNSSRGVINDPDGDGTGTWNELYASRQGNFKIYGR